MEIRTKNEIIYRTLASEIIEKKIPVGEQLPSGLELAKRFGVAHLTVRRVLKKLQQDNFIRIVNGVGSFALERKAKIESRNILIVASPVSPLESCVNYILSGITQYCSEHNYGIDFLNESFLTGEDRIGFAGRLREKGYLGVLFPRSNFIGGEPEFDALKELNLPVVLPHASPVDHEISGYATLYTDQKAAWRSALEHLRELGHRRVALILMQSHIGEYRGRTMQQHINLLKKLDMEATPDNIIVCESYNDSTFAGKMRAVLARKNGPTAVLGYSDFWAIKAYDEIKRRKWNIPGDISVMGFCGFPGGEYLSPALSTIDFSYNEIGRSAAALLLDSAKWFGKGGETPLLKSPYRCLPRASTAPCPPRR